MCAYLRLDSIKENIEGDANLHHPPRNRVKDEDGQPNSVKSLFVKKVLTNIVYEGLEIGVQWYSFYCF